MKVKKLRHYCTEFPHFKIKLSVAVMTPHKSTNSTRVCAAELALISNVVELITTAKQKCAASYRTSATPKRYGLGTIHFKTWVSKACSKKKRKQKMFECFMNSSSFHQFFTCQFSFKFLLGSYPVHEMSFTLSELEGVIGNGDFSWAVEGLMYFWPKLHQ